MSAKRADGWLRSLTVEGFGLIERTDVLLGSGLNVFTGETGSGKSMVIDALGFAFGARAGADVVRAGSTKAVVNAEVEPNAAALAWMQASGFDQDPGEPLIVSREMSAQGRSSARIGGRPATAAQLRDLGDLLLDMVGQHEHTRLARQSLHREALDAFAGEATARVRERVASRYAERRDLAARIDVLERSASAAERILADARYAAVEIEAARLRDGEIEELRERRALLANAAKISQALQAASSALGDGDGGAVSQIGKAAASLEHIAPFGAHFRELASTAKGLQGAASDLYMSIGAHEVEVDEQPGALDALEERLALIERLQKKYGSTVAEIVATGERFAEQARGIEHRDEDLAALRRQRDVAAGELQTAASELTRERTVAAMQLGKRVGEELRLVGMRGAAFRCAVDPKADGIGPDGADRIEFFATLNENEPERPIARAASGGELSRLLLALKVALADVDPHPIVVLDEIDAGIGGAAARSVGARIAALARSVQVLCVTHLAQIAVQADHHIALEKGRVKNRSTITARTIDTGDARRKEIARMLSGDERGAEARDHADALLREARG